MNAGRELDVLVAQQVFGHSVVKQGKRPHVEGTPKGVRTLGNYSTDITFAWEVVEKLGMTLIPIEGGSWFAFVGKNTGWKSPAEFIQSLQKGEFMEAGAAVSETAALSICVAALKAVEKREAQDKSNDQTPTLSLVN